MFKVIVVDDEPGALAHLCSIIEKKCGCFQIAGTAENGVEALELICKKDPDVVIADVKMPLMNGIELVSKLKTEFPSIFSIIVSGYNEFEYAQGAIKSGVCDYILKPVLPSALQNIMDELAEKLRVLYYQNRNNIMRKLCSQGTIYDNVIEKYFPHQNYYGAIIRKNGLPRRFSAGNEVEIYSDINELVNIYGRDEMEAFYLVPEELLCGKSFEYYITNVYKKECADGHYTTLVYGKCSFPAGRLQAKVRELYKILDIYSTVGENQILNLEKCSEAGESELEQKVINSVISDLEHLLLEQRYDKFKNELRCLFKRWEKEKKPQLWVEQASRQIMYLVVKYRPESIALIEYEYMIEDAFFYSISMEELLDNFIEIIFKSFKDLEGSNKVDSPEFFAQVDEYMHKHIADSITLQSVCRKFGISQTYLSKLFRKYKGESFNRYLTSIRVKRAVELIELNPEVFVKDIAAKVGFNDQFYFSRIFRSYTGICPTDFMEQIEMENTRCVPGRLSPEMTGGAYKPV